MATKITYATLASDSLDDLHRALDAAIGSAPKTFGRDHPLYINGKSVAAEKQFEDRVLSIQACSLGGFNKHKDHVRPPSPRRARPTPAGPPCRGRSGCVRSRDRRGDRSHRWIFRAHGNEVARTASNAWATSKRPPISCRTTATDRTAHGFVEKMHARPSEET